MIEIRPAAPADFDAVGRLTVAAYRADGQLDGLDPYERRLLDVASRAHDNEVLVAVDDADRVLGAVTILAPGSELVELSRPGEAEFRMLAVDPAAQGQGVGAALVTACVDRARERRATALVISSRDFAKAAHRLYQRMGFVRVPELDWSPEPGVRLVALRLELSG